MSALLLAVLWAAGAGPAFSQSSAIYAWTNSVGPPGGPGNAEGPGSAARFCHPQSAAVDSAGNGFVGDTENCTIRKSKETESKGGSL